MLEKEKEISELLEEKSNSGKRIREEYQKKLTDLKQSHKLVVDGLNANIKKHLDSINGLKGELFEKRQLELEKKRLLIKCEVQRAHSGNRIKDGCVD